MSTTKTRSARPVELSLETVRLLQSIQPLRVIPAMPVVLNTLGGVVEPQAFCVHWYACLRALNVRQPGLYAIKDTFVTTALDAGVRPAWLEQQTGVAYETLRRHYGKFMPSRVSSDRDRLASTWCGTRARRS